MTDGSGAATPLHVETDLSVTVDGTEARLRSTGDRLFLEFPSVVAAVEALRSLPATERRQVHEALTAADLTLEVQARQRTLVALGADTVSGPLARRLGVDPVEVRLGGALSAIWAGGASIVRRLR